MYMLRFSLSENNKNYPSFLYFLSMNGNQTAQWDFCGCYRDFMWLYWFFGKCIWFIGISLFQPLISYFWMLEFFERIFTFFAFLCFRALDLDFLVKSNQFKTFWWLKLCLSIFNMRKMKLSTNFKYSIL